MGIEMGEIRGLRNFSTAEKSEGGPSHSRLRYLHWIFPIKSVPRPLSVLPSLSPSMIRPQADVRCF
jgi:hypothetical protein